MNTTNNQAKIAFTVFDAKRITIAKVDDRYDFRVYDENDNILVAVVGPDQIGILDYKNFPWKEAEPVAWVDLERAIKTLEVA